MQKIILYSLFSFVGQDLTFYLNNFSIAKINVCLNKMLLNIHNTVVEVLLYKCLLNKDESILLINCMKMFHRSHVTHGASQWKNALKAQRMFLLS